MSKMIENPYEVRGLIVEAVKSGSAWAIDQDGWATVIFTRGEKGQTVVTVTVGHSGMWATIETH